LDTESGRIASNAGHAGLGLAKRIGRGGEDAPEVESAFAQEAGAKEIEDAMPENRYGACPLP
jgi:hypothetical protein